VVPSPDTTPERSDALAQLRTLIDESPAAASIPARTRIRARAEALALAEADGGTPLAQARAAELYAARLLEPVAVDLASSPSEARRLLHALQAEAGVSRVGLGRELLHGGGLLELPGEVAIEVALALLVAFSEVGAIGLWTRVRSGEPRLVAHGGELDREAPDAVARARAVLAGEDPDASAAVRIPVLRGPVAALVAYGTDGAHAGSDTAGPLMAAAAPLLAALLDRESLTAGEHAQDAVIGTVERRLARLRFDLHDGPQQDVHLLGADLALFRDQLRPLIAGHPDERRVIGRLDDLEAQLVALDGDLRRLLTSVQSPLLAEPLPDAIAQLTGAFAGRTGIVPEVSFGALTGPLTDSQQIALLSLVREALSNIRRHSGARRVQIAIGTESDGVHVTVTDDGAGFDPEATLMRAARAGRLGVVGMHERVRMLGGRTQINSRSGGPTTVSATLPPWPDED
jgi:signal transduction histidine kinase